MVTERYCGFAYTFANPDAKLAISHLSRKEIEEFFVLVSGKTTTNEKIRTFRFKRFQSIILKLDESGGRRRLVGCASWADTSLPREFHGTG